MSGFRFRLMVTSVAVAGGALSIMLEGPWTTGGALAAIIAAVVVIISGVYEFILGPRWRRRVLRQPCKAWFLIASTQQRKIDHAVQDHQQHYVEELTLASHSEYDLDFCYVPTITFTVADIYFGFNKQDDRDLDTKPIIKSYHNRFIERGIPEESPETHPETNYADHHKYYHLIKSKNIARHECYTIGCKIQTRKAGRYEFNLFFSGEEVGQPTNKMFVRVEDNPTTKMKCTFPKHRECFVQPARKA
jgi:hypothetical protein